MLNFSSSFAKKSNRYTKWELPDFTQSLCPICLEVVDAELYENSGKVFMRKTCATHGLFDELISSDAQFFKKLRRTHYEMPSGIDNPNCRNLSSCPRECGLCEQHLSAPAMVNIDLTNRCNQKCPICFANANVSGRLYEITLEQLDKMLDIAANIRPYSAPCLQYVGGEPTIYPYFLEALKRAKQKGFSQIQVASNGKSFADSFEFTQASAEAGLEVVYLQFDGLDDQIYLKTRGRPLVETKLKAIENIKKANMRVILVPTIANGINDHHLGDILRFAIDNVDVIGGISWQPVAITGRIDKSQRRQMRFTTADLARNLQEQCGFIDMYRDWFPFSQAIPFAKILEVLSGQPQMRCSCSPHCGCATYLVIDKQKKKAVPLPAFIDIEPAMEMLNKTADRIKKYPWLRNISVMRILKGMKKYFHPELAPEGWGFEAFLEFMNSFIELGQQRNDKQAYMRRLQQDRFGTLLLASMHFQDQYNYEISRSRHCIVLYVAPNGRLYPFCTWNSGLCHRYKVEEAFSKPLARIKEIPAGIPEMPHL